MVTTYGSGRTQLPFSSSNVAVTTSGGSLGVTGTYYISISAQNKVGLNLPSTLVPITVTPTSFFTITFPTILSGEYWENIIISASTTNDSTTLTQIASISISIVTTPLVLTSSNVLKVTLADRTVALPSNLPSNAEQGLIRYVSSTNYYYVFDNSSTATIDGLSVLNNTSGGVGKWLRIGSISTSITDVTASGGCNQDVRTPGLTVNETPYAVDGSQGTGTVFFIRNDSDAVIPSGSRVSCIVSFAGEDRSQLFSNLLILDCQGYVDTSTGILDNTNAIGAIPYQPQSQYLVLPNDLPIGKAAVITVYPKFSVADLDNEVYYGATIGTYVFFAPVSGVYAPGVFGNIIYPSDQRWRIYPGTGNSVIKGKGSGIILRQELNLLAAETISVTSNTANQNIFVTPLGNSFASTISSSNAALIRATISTVSGEANATNYGTINLTASNQLVVTVNYSNYINSLYPDLHVAGALSTNNASQANIYIKTPSNTYYKYTYTITPSATSDTQTLSLSNFTSVSGLPSNASNFGLFIPSSVTIATNSTSGGFTSGTYTVYVSYYYSGCVTVIDHSTSQLIETNTDLGVIFNGAYSELFNGVGAPSNSLGKNNDYYLDTSTGNIYQKTSGSFSIVYNTAGTPGATGTGAYTTITASFTQPASSSTVTVSVANTSWMAVGEPIFISTAGTYTVSTINSSTSVTLTNLGYSTNAAATTTIASGQAVVATGLQGTGSGGSSIQLAGVPFCTTGCSITGSTKAFTVYAAYSNITLNIVVGFSIASLISNTSDAIQFQYWSQAPNTSFTGRVWVASMGNTGGTVTTSFTSTYKWFSIFARQASNSNYYKGVCFTVNGNTITLIGFS